MQIIPSLIPPVLYTPDLLLTKHLAKHALFFPSNILILPPNICSHLDFLIYIYGSVIGAASLNHFSTTGCSVLINSCCFSCLAIIKTIAWLH
uniref:Uncharacterized protein n=1 Tax=Pyxicephalus adspersus TaxID=30357 RepID=A0AAV3AQ79_PYXAD|nr:TPA: hypothetical protein GDO54_011934 [Pyxicephalus adspersus]